MSRPANIDEVSEEGWKTVVDFTNGGKTDGMPIKMVIEEMKKVWDL